MKTIFNFTFALTITLLTAQATFATCDVKDLKKDLQEIQLRKDYNSQEKRIAIEQAKQNFREDVIECALEKEAITPAAAKLAVQEIENDQSTKPAAAKELIGLIESNTSDF